jgi:hypothetical protein
MTENETTETCRTIGVPEAGRRYFGLGRGASYTAAANGQIPTIRIGRILRVPVIALERMLEIAGEGAPRSPVPESTNRRKFGGIAPA